jgi:hypothetical protein
MFQEGSSMEHARHGAVTLEAAGRVLARSKVVQTTLREALKEPDASAALAMLKSGSLVGDLGAEVHDLLADAIVNGSTIVWDGAIPGDEFDFPVHVKSFGGVFYVWAMECDDVGYFLSRSRAVDFIRGNWDGVRGRVCR